MKSEPLGAAVRRPLGETIMTERTFAAIVAGGLFAATPASADLLMNFQDDRDDAATLPFYIAFGVGFVGYRAQRNRAVSA